MFDRREEVPALYLPRSGQLRGTEQDHVQQVNCYADLKRSQTLFCDYIVAAHPEQVKLIQLLKTCSSWLFFHTFETGDEEISRLVGGITCKKHLFCICCATRRSARYAKTYENAVRYLLEQHPYLVPVLITYTVKNGPDLLERFEHLRKAQRTLLYRRRQCFCSTTTARIDTILRYIHGGAGSYEVKIGSGSGEWHIHIHEIALLDAREFTFTEELVPVRRKNPHEIQRFKVIYVPQGFKSALRDEWFALTKDSDQVDVRGLYPRDKYSKLAALPADLSDPSCLVPSDSSSDAIFSGGCEAFKYALKPGDMTHEQLYHAATSLSNQRMVYSYGSLHNVKVPDEFVDDIEDELRSYSYYERVYRYYDIPGEDIYGYFIEEINRGEDIRIRPSSSLRDRKDRKKIYALNKKRKKADLANSALNVRKWVDEYLSHGDSPPF